MPEQLISDIKSNESLVIQNQLLELRRKLQLEEKMMEASRLIKGKLDQLQNVQQVQNSIRESEDRITFLKEQIVTLERNLKMSQLKRTCSDLSEYPDAFESLSITPTREDSIKLNINWWLSDQKLTWPKIEYKINELSSRLKVNENILEAEDKLIEAMRVHLNQEDQGKNSKKSDNSGYSDEALKLLQESKEVTKQRVTILSQALKKYTSLCTSSMNTSTTTSPSITSSLSTSNHFGTLIPSAQFTGKLGVKILKVSGMSGSGAGTKSNKSITSVVVNPSSPKKSTIDFTCNQEVELKLVNASELEITLSSGGSNSNNIKGIFFIKLATLLSKSSEIESSIHKSFEFDPVGSVEMQFHYEPNMVKKEQLAKARMSRIERKPAIKRTQHFIQGHELISTNFFQLLKCSYCQYMIMNTSGYQCKTCKLICHKKCYSKIFNKCLNWDGKTTEDNSTDIEEALDPLIDAFTSKFNIPHKQKHVTVAIPSWCSHCGHMLPLGRKVNYKCEECSLMWHDRCDPHICKNHCGLTSTIVEAYYDKIKEVNLKRETSKATIKSQVSTSASLKTSISSASVSKNTSFKTPALSINDFNLIKCIGKGNFGKVMLANHNSDPNKYYAIKMLKKHSIVENEEYESIRTEKKVFRLASEENNPFLVQIHSIFHDDYRIYFVMEYVSGGDLMFHIQNRAFSLSDCKFYAAQVLLALEYLHSRGVLYRDLKLDNILLTLSGNIKLTDYGLSKCDMKADSKTKTFCGTPEFMAPELLLDQPYGMAIDFWAFGILLYQMLENRSPFYGESEKETFQSILKGKLQFSSSIDKNGKSIISKLLQSNPLERLGMKGGSGWKAVKEHSFFAEINWEALKQLRVTVPFVPIINDSQDVSNFDELFTSEDVLLTPYPSFTFVNGGVNIQKAISIFAEFST